MRKYFLFLLVSGFPLFCTGQKVDTKRDSALYNKINHYSQKSKVTQWLYSWVFRSPSSSIYNSKAGSPEYSSFEGKIIRHIRVKSLDPFGYAIDDSTRQPHNWLEKWGNAFHVKSKGMAIRKYLLFKKEKPLDTLLLHESARLLREQYYVRKVRIIPHVVGKNKDSVDVLVKILDSWSIIPDGGIDAHHFKVRIKERNFIGMGHQLEMQYAKRITDGTNGYSGIYRVPNIDNTFINLTAKYEMGYEGFYDKFIYVNREFYSPLARWAGGALLQNRSLQSELPTDSLTFQKHPFAYSFQDYWGGYAFHLLKGESEKDRTTNLIVGLRTYLLNYKTDSYGEDTIPFYSNEHFYLGSVGLSFRQYVRDRYIFRDGEVEDVPIGAIYSVTAGLQRKNKRSRFYLGLRAAYGNYFDWGFWGSNFEIGSFFNADKHLEQSTISFTANYFSPLLTLGAGWKLRQFIKPRFVLGFNRKNTIVDRVELNDKNYFKGVNSYHYIDYLSKKKYIDYENGSLFGFESPVIGTRKYVLDLQTQLYSPWSFWGFRVNPFLRFSMGYLSGGESKEAEHKFYTSIGLGVIIRNDYLVFGSFQLSLSYYPSMPGNGYNIFKTNSFTTGDYGFQNFEIGEPRPVIYE